MLPGEDSPAQSRLPRTVSLSALSQAGGVDLLSVADWLSTDGARLGSFAELFAEVGSRLLAAGLPVMRMRVGAQTLHPEMAAWSAAWTADTGNVASTQARHGISETGAYQNSPVHLMRLVGTGLRWQMGQLDAERDHSVLFELRDAGAVDYVILPIPMEHDRLAYLSLAFADPGLVHCDLAALVAFGQSFGPLLAAHAHRHMAVSLLETYVGKRTGQRVLAGHVRRGDVERIDAAFWYSDLRGFTQMSEDLSSKALIETLNSYFEVVTAAITARGGEILQFIGDAVLAVFEAGDDLNGACQSAVDAAIDAQAALAVINARRSRAGQPLIRFGIGLHYGEVAYGNVGAFDRMGFNAVGPAVNRTARIESLTKEFGCDLLMSEPFAQRIALPTEAVGSRPMKGIAEQMTLYRLVEGL